MQSRNRTHCIIDYISSYEGNRSVLDVTQVFVQILIFRYSEIYLDVLQKHEGMIWEYVHNISISWIFFLIIPSRFLIEQEWSCYEPIIGSAMKQLIGWF
jgi:hypothetical protein